MVDDNTNDLRLRHADSIDSPVALIEYGPMSSGTRRDSGRSRTFFPPAADSKHSIRSQMDEAIEYARQFPHYPLAIYSTLWLILLTVLVYFSLFAATVDGETPINLSCRSWGYSIGPPCGIDGIDCGPFNSSTPTAFRCPTRCTWDQSSVLEVVGSGPYKATSRICKAAIHAGVISQNGGCALMTLTGSQIAFSGSDENGVASTEFNSWFPKSFDLSRVSSSNCTDLAWPILVLLCIALFGLAWFRNASGLYILFVLNGCGYWYVVLIGQPMSTNYKDIVANGLAEFSIVLCATYAFYQMTARHTFVHWRVFTRKKRCIFWLVYLTPYLIGIHLNVIAYLPWLNIDIGGYDNGSEQANVGTIVIFVLGGILGLALIVWQLKQLNQIGKFVKYMAIYLVSIILAISIWQVFLPSYVFHLHHAIVGVVILSLSRFPYLPAAALQGLALGLFVQGYAAWGWDSYVERIPTRFTLPILDPPQAVNDTITATSANVTWETDTSVEGYSLMLNGVMKYRGHETSYVLENLIANMTYYVSVSVIGSFGIDGRVSDEGKFITLE